MRDIILKELNQGGNINAVQWIYNYCIYKGKTPQDTLKFIQALMEDPMMVLQMTELINGIIKSFKRELEIYSVIDLTGKTILYY